MDTVDHHPKPKSFREKIGIQEYELQEAKLDVFDEVTLWPGNPRLREFVPSGHMPNEEELEHHLQKSSGYDGLARSIEDLGQMEPVYAWRRDGAGKYLILEGATRVSILRALARKKQGHPDEPRFRKVIAKVLPDTFSEEERVILLARIHVRGSGVRAWGRYIEAEFIYENVTDRPGKKALMSITDLANHMGKSSSWVSRLKDAYEFARRFVDHVDDPKDGTRLGVEYFSTLEEISKATGFGSKVKDYENKEFDPLRADVFEMVRNDVFKEYRDARFMKAFHDDPEKWAQLKTGEKHLAHKLANEIKAGNVGLKGRIAALPTQVDRALADHGDAFDEQDAESLRTALTAIERQVNVGVSPFRLRLREFTRALENATLADIRQVIPDELEELNKGIEYFRERLNKYGSWGESA